MNHDLQLVGGVWNFPLSYADSKVSGTRTALDVATEDNVPSLIAACQYTSRYVVRLLNLAL